MTHYKTGTHTVEIMANQYINTTMLPYDYGGAIEPIKGMRYKLNVTKTPNGSEYQKPSETDAAIRNALNVIGVKAALNRVDYRLDNHDEPYIDELKLMTALVHLIAHKTRQSERIQYTQHGAPMQIHSVRCMPDKDDHETGYGVEYYNKEYQRQNTENGRGRLELRRLNMGGGTVRTAVVDWKNLLEGITRPTYLYMLEEHARQLAQGYHAGTPKDTFIDRITPELIGREEEPMLRKLIGSGTHKRKAAHLPRWGEIKTHIDWIISHLDQALNAE